MTNNQENKLSMYLTVQQVTNYHSSVWQDFAGFKDLFNDFEGIIQKIKDTRLVQERKITGVTKDKKDLRNNAVEKGLVIANAIFIHASENGNNKLADRVSYNLSDFTRGRDTIIIDRLQVIKEAAQLYAAELDYFGVSQDDVDEFAALTEQLTSIVENPRQAITNRSRATKQLSEYILKADTMIKNRLDRLINQFKSNSPDFWQQFKNARKIIDLGHRKRVNENDEEQLLSLPVTQ